MVSTQQPVSQAAAGKTAHGTRAGWSRHQRRGEPPCAPCRRAMNAYMRNRRASNEEVRKYDRRRSSIRGTALERLAREYSARFTELLAEERQTRLIPPQQAEEVPSS